MAISRTNDNIIYAGTAPLLSRARVFKSLDGGDSWIDITGILPDRYLTDLAVDQLNDNIVYCAASGFGSPHIYRSSNGGEEWTNIARAFRMFLHQV